MGIRENIKSARASLEKHGVKNLVGLFGFPVSHSLSPAMHNEAFKSLGMDDWHYESFDIPPEELKNATDAIREEGIRGVNVTIPHKENIIPFLDTIDENARKIGAVNTITNTDGKLTGYNTDYIGFLRALEEERFSPKNKNVLVIGAGGAAQAVLYALKSAGAKEIFIYDISEEKSRQLAGKYSAISIGRKFFTNENGEIAKLNLIINASPVGMRASDSLPGFLNDDFFSKLSSYAGSKSILIYDLIYNRKTRLIETAQEKGLKSAGGLGMLLYQGAEAFKMWTGRDAPLEVMRKILVDKFSKSND